MNTNKIRTYTFKDILWCLFNAEEVRLGDYIDMIKSNNMDGKLLPFEDAEALDAFDRLFHEAGNRPTVDLFKSFYPNYDLESDVTTSDVGGIIRVFIKQRKNLIAANDLMKEANKLAYEGLTPEIADAIAEVLKSDATDLKYENIEDKIVDIYERAVDKSGIKTGISVVDEMIGGLKPGQVSTIAGYSGQGKSVTAVSIMYSAIKQGFNVCYLSLELGKDHLMFNLISRHSLDIKFARKIEHRDLKEKKLSNEDWDYVKSVILPDLQSLPGKPYILDEQDIEAYTFFAFNHKLQEIENLCIENTGKGLDLIIVDHVQMLAFSDQGSRLSENTVINRWCNYFRSNCLDFLKTKRQIHVMMAAQINREGFKKAAANQGMYSLTALKEANEIETCSSVVLGIYSSPDSILSDVVKIGIMKNRDGGRLNDAYEVPAKFAYQLVGENGPILAATLAKIGVDDLISISDFDLDDDSDWTTTDGFDWLGKDAEMETL